MNISAGGVKKRILIIGPSNIGDMILAADVVRILREQFKDAHLSLALGSRARSLFVGDERIQTLVDLGAYESIWKRVQLVVAFWRYQPHVIVDLHGTIYPVLLKPWHVLRYIRLVPRRITHMRDRHLWKLKTQVPKIQLTSKGNSINCLDDDELHIKKLLEKFGIKSDVPIVIICPGARSHIKRWKAEGFAQVADKLIESLGVEVIFSGEISEEPIVRQVQSSMNKNSHSAVGLTTIRQAAVLMKRASLVITNDSASLHVASSVDVPTIAIFGPTDSNSYGPLSTKRAVVKRKLFCAPCMTALCRFNHECMSYITTEEVFDSARSIMESKREASI